MFFFEQPRGELGASPAGLGQIGPGFGVAMETLAWEHAIAMVHFQKGE